MKSSILALIGAGLFFTVGPAAANEVILAGLFDGDRRVLEHNCAEEKATSGNDFEIITQCGPGNR